MFFIVSTTVIRTENLLEPPSFLGVTTLRSLSLPALIPESHWYVLHCCSFIFSRLTNEIICNLWFWLCSLSIMPLRFIRVGEYVNSLFLFVAEWYFPVWIHHSLIWNEKKNISKKIKKDIWVIQRWVPFFLCLVKIAIMEWKAFAT